MAQEALNNTVRHAQATQAGLSVDYADDGVMLAVTDNGQGFTVPDNRTSFAPAGHYGLLGLHERAELIGARLAIQSAPGRGTTVRVSL
jgi:signal transduction histidine kinase